MLLTMVVSLYTSRVVLNTLGVEDFGIYNVVGGFVGMFGFLNNAMTSATQRFLSYELGRDDKIGVSNVFNISLLIHCGIALAAFILAETIGLWFLLNKLEIPHDRIDAANWVYHFSILALMVNIVSVPYNSLIIAYEKMGAFASISVIEVVLKLLIVLLLEFFGSDKLQLYAVLTFAVSFIIRVLYGIYCKIKISEIRFRFYWDKPLFKKILNQVSWYLFGTSAQILSDQGLNILLNLFFGVTVNAARAISFQVRNSVQSFVINFMIAVRPQIIKLYAMSNFSEMYKLVFFASKVSFSLLLVITLPVFILAPTVLTWWLKVLPDHTVLFTRLILIDLFFTVLFTSLNTVSQASGKLRLYQIVVSIGFLLNFIFSYGFFKMGFPSYVTFLIIIFFSMLSLFARLIILKKQSDLPFLQYMKEVLGPSLLVIVFSVPLPLFLYQYTSNGTFIQFILVCGACLFSVIGSFWFVGLKVNERKEAYSFILRVFDKIFK